MLDEQRRSIGTLLGSVERGNDVFARAAEFGRRYGFTQKEMGESAEAAAPLIRTSTTAVEKQLEVLGRLASLNAREGFSGAVFSTGELASGDITSIVERFRLNRDAAREMKEEIAAGADVFQVLDAQLTKMGVTADVLTNRMQGTAGATRTYAQAQEDLTLALGQFVDGPGVQALDFLSKFTTTLTGILSKGDAFAGAAAGADAIQAQLVGAATSYEDYGNRLTAVNQQVRGELSKTDPVFAALVGNINQLTTAQFAYAQSLIQTGTAQEQATQQAQGLGDFFQHLATIQTAAAANNQATAASLAALTPQMAQAAALGPETAQGVLVMAAATAIGTLEVDNFRAALAGLIGHHEAVAQSAALDRIETEHLTRSQINAADAAHQYAEALNADAVEALIAEANTQALTRRKEELREAAIAAAGGLGSTTDQAAILAGQLDLTEKEAYDLINALRQVPGSPIANVGKGLTSGLSGSQPKFLERGAGQGAIEVDKLTDSLVKLRNERIQQNAIDANRQRGGGGAAGAARLGDAQKLNNALSANQSTFQDRTEDAERRHQENLLKIEDDFERKSLAQQSSNEKTKREGRYNFYKSLADAGETLGEAEATAYSAAYEQAFAESQALAQAGQHKLAADRLALRQQQIQQDIEAAKAIAEAEEAGNAKRAESLRQLEVLRKDSQTEDLKQLEGRGDQLVNDRQQAIDEEATRYSTAQEQNALSAERKAERAVTAAEREQKAIGDTNTLLAEQQRLYGQMGPRGAAPVAPAASIPASGPPAGAVGAATAFAVFDAAVVGAINAQTRTLGDKLDKLDKLDTLISRVEAVERAVRAGKSPGSVE